MRAPITLLFVAFVAAVAAQSAVDRAEVRLASQAPVVPDVQRQLDLRDHPLWTAFLTDHPHWQVEFNAGTGMPHRAYGPPVQTAPGTEEERALEFLQPWLSAAGVGPTDIRHQATYRTSRNTYIHFRQTHAGHPVITGQAMVKLDPHGRVIAFGCDVLPTRLIPALGTFTEASATAASSGLAEVYATEVNGLRWLPIPQAHGVEVHLVQEVVVHARANGRPARYQCWVDALSGALHYRQDLNSDAVGCAGEPADAGADVVVEGTYYITGPLGGTAVTGLPDLRVSINANTLFTDASGALASGIPGPVNAQFQLRGRWANVSTNAITPSTSAFLQEGPNTVSFDAAANIRQRSAYVHVNRIHEHMQAVLPGFTAMDIALPTKVDVTGGTCNAFYDGSSINFHAEGGGCQGMAAFHDVVYHEYGHGINDKFYQGLGGLVINAAMSEGYADLWAWSLTQQPSIGAGYRIGDDLAALRRYDEAPRVYPMDLVGQRHADGMIISGAWWDLYQALGNDMDLLLQLFADALPGLQATAINGQEGIAFRDVLLDVLQADDDDGDITNGTPHGQAIIEAFARHGITLVTGSTLQHTPLADAVVGEALQLQATLDAPFPSNLYLGDVLLNYRVDAGPWEVITCTNTGGVTYAATLPFVASGGLVAYYFTVMDTNGQVGIALPKGAHLDPANLPFFVLLGMEQAGQETADGPGDLALLSAGVPQDNATGGAWAEGVPVPSYALAGFPSSIVQPGTQQTPGGTRCWFTGNAPSDADPTGTNDVDGGVTTLISAPFDASTLTDPVITYWRWYVNNAAEGSNPGTDPWRVSLSNDGGASWVPVEDTPVSDRSWRRMALRIAELVEPTAAMRIRFQASDSVRTDQPFDGASLVEAAVDDLALWESTTLNVGSDEHTTSAIRLVGVPADQVLVVDADLPDDVRLSITDAMGRACEVRMRGPMSGRVALNVGHLANGTYLLLVYGPHHADTVRFSVLH